VKKADITTGTTIIIVIAADITIPVAAVVPIHANVTAVLEMSIWPFTAELASSE
jgi:hypothetical protein